MILKGEKFQITSTTENRLKMKFMRSCNWKIFLFSAAVLLPRLAVSLEISDLTPVETRAIELACPNSGSDSLCIKKHLLALSRVKRFDLDLLNKYDRLVLKNICETKSVLTTGPALYYTCLIQEIVRWKGSDKVILNNLSKNDQAQLVGNCGHEMNQGLVQFHECLLSALRREIGGVEPPKEPPPTNNPEAGIDNPDAQQLFNILSPSVVMIGTMDNSESGWSTGSGVAVSKSQILTNYHVVEGANHILVKHGHFEDQATIEWKDRTGDMCILRIQAHRLQPVAVAKCRPYDSINVGEKVYSLGSPGMLENTFAVGMLSGKRTINGRKYLQTSAPISPGSSGGGLFDVEGRLIGITTSGIEGTTLGFAIPIDSFPLSNSCN
jgi:hypothetical protein